MILLSIFFTFSGTKRLLRSPYIRIIEWSRKICSYQLDRIGGYRLSYNLWCLKARHSRIYLLKKNDLDEETLKLPIRGNLDLWPKNGKCTTQFSLLVNWIKSTMQWPVTFLIPEKRWKFYKPYSVEKLVVEFFYFPQVLICKSHFQIWTQIKLLHRVLQVLESSYCNWVVLYAYHYFSGWVSSSQLMRKRQCSISWEDRSTTPLR